MKPILRDLNVEILPIDSLEPYRLNARKHSQRQVAQIADAIREFGWTALILVDETGSVIAGHGRLEAARLLRLDQVPTICVDGLTSSQIRALRLADNKLAENSEWDFDTLKIELTELFEADFALDLRTTGFDMAELDQIVGEYDDEKSAADRPFDSDFDGPAIAQRGDMFELDGRHRLLCGDALNDGDIEKLMGGEKARFCFTDPPYNVPIEDNVSGLGRKKHGDFAMASGEMTRRQFTDFLSRSFDLIAGHCTDGAIVDVCMDHKHLVEVITAGENAFSELKNICVWTKRNGGMGSLYRSAHEFVLIFKSGTAPHINNVQLGRFGRNRTNVWSYAGVNSFGSGRKAALAMHPTVKPVAMVADAIFDCSNQRDIVLDPFAGSGTILIAAHRTGRKARAIEFDPKYVDVCLRRFRRVTGIDSLHLGSGMTFGKLEARASAGSDEGGTKI